ncbi:MAG TPA: Uma2 family endonuclease [Acetobacteraceae bacterium]|nr:Uma2 family endonuclease [Acetobacteraceae bacterium]
MLRSSTSGYQSPPMDIDTSVLPSRLFTVAEYHRMAEVRVFGEDERVEQFDAQVVAMAPIRPRHALIVDVLSRWFRAPRDRWWARFRNPIDLDERTEPNPDVVLAHMPWSSCSSPCRRGARTASATSATV